MTEPRKLKRALLSVSDKTGIVKFAKILARFDVEIISTGGTAKILRENGLEVIDVSDVTGYPEMMDGRVKTLHPSIHGAFLALRDNNEHRAAMKAHGIEPIDIVVVNLYPFEETVAKDGVSLEEAVENIDIGGPAMIRSAAKNFRDVAVVTETASYQRIIDELEEDNGSISLETRQLLAVRAFAHTATYDGVITNYFTKRGFASETKAVAESESQLEKRISIELVKVTDLRYGENPHQKAALYTSGKNGGIARAEQLHGKEMSFNNYVDAEAAWNLVEDFDTLAVAIIKHTNPSGVGIGTTNEEAYRRALSTDPVSAFGGIVAFNRRVDAAAAACVNGVFTEVVVAPDYDETALDLFRDKKNLRVLRVAPNRDQSETRNLKLEIKQISGGFLVQGKDMHRLSEGDLKVVTTRQPTPYEVSSMRLAWKVCKHVKSNAIVFANPVQTLGVGAGQMNRIDSVRIAAMRAKRFELPLKGSALASDAFFPFRDNVDEAAKFGISAIIQPGGSIKDEESIAAANEHGVTMAFTGIRHFNH